MERVSKVASRGSSSAAIDLTQDDNEMEDIRESVQKVLPMKTQGLNTLGQPSKGQNPQQKTAHAFKAQSASSSTDLKARPKVKSSKEPNSSREVSQKVLLKTPEPNLELQGRKVEHHPISHRAKPVEDHQSMEKKQNQDLLRAQQAVSNNGVQYLFSVSKTQQDTKNSSLWGSSRVIELQDSDVSKNLESNQSQKDKNSRPAILPLVENSGINQYVLSPSLSAKAQNLLSLLDDFAPHVQQSTEGLRLTRLANISARSKQKWIDPTTTWPRLLPSQQCWQNESPTYFELYAGTLDIIQKCVNDEKAGKEDAHKTYCLVYNRGTDAPKMDRRRALAQLGEPDKNNPIGLIGYKLPWMDNDDSIAVPEELSNVTEPDAAKGLQLLLTPKYWCTDLHIDLSDGISWTVSDCEKLWLMYPPTQHNIDLLVKDGRRLSKLGRIGKELEGGVIFRAASDQAVYIPIGCIHAVFTLKGGFLCSYDLSTTDSVRTLSTLLKSRFDAYKDDYSKSELPGLFQEAVQLALDKEGRVELGLKSWIETRERIEEWADKSLDNNQDLKNQDWIDKREDWKEAVRSMWKMFFSGRLSRNLGCPCGAHVDSIGFEEHFTDTHIPKALQATPKTTPKPAAKTAAAPKRRLEEDADFEMPSTKTRRKSRYPRPELVRDD